MSSILEPKGCGWKRLGWMRPEMIAEVIVYIKILCLVLPAADGKWGHRPVNVPSN